jgi:hypothetical protein
MKNANAAWTKQELRILKTRFQDGMTDKQMSQELQRSSNAIQQKRVQMKLMRKKGGQPKLVQGKYTRKKSSVTEISLLWGLVKYTKA